VTADYNAASTVMITFVRRSLLALTMIGIAATAFELATERHWNGLEQLIPWFALAALAVAVVLAVLPGRGAQLMATVFALVVLGASVYGVLDHITVNYNSGPLDQRFADSWDSLPASRRWWYAVTKQVGPSPPLAPGILAQTALLLLLASLMRRKRVKPEPTPAPA
jgi:lysylphosphatidylglycerol synthetase-like protein (DUF2156 family)